MFFQNNITNQTENNEIQKRYKSISMQRRSPIAWPAAENEDPCFYLFDLYNIISISLALKNNKKQDHRENY